MASGGLIGDVVTQFSAGDTATSSGTHAEDALLLEVRECE